VLGKKKVDGRFGWLQNIGPHAWGVARVSWKTVYRQGWVKNERGMQEGPKREEDSAGQEKINRKKVVEGQ